ncbi:unnamed protein product [Medioppia subpectinata]|uniref:Nuclear receptor domain-containing protein n=1 Tax=Medioppia subpectinata TaxID=1979941 RepID=A0A7R9KL80_9ACAR|nr:unnamed protein product [Medioppia subpectinata]CAG2105657.1 unnamed protein product [Medioppia subpectinata]
MSFNFNAITCESCKVMFRRNAQNFDKLKCNFRDNCRIDLKNRKYCKKCRLAKCFAAGMKKDNIMSNEEKQRRAQKIEHNRQKKHRRQEEVRALVASLDTCADTISSGESMASMAVIKKLEAMTNNYELMAARLRELESYSMNRRWTDISYNIYQKVVDMEFTAPAIGRPLSDRLMSFNELEFDRFRELLTAAQSMASTPPALSLECQRQVIRDFNSGLQCPRNVSRITAIYVEGITANLVKMSKHFDAFVGMCENDQIIMVKHACFEICVIRAIICFNFQYEYWSLALDSEYSVVMKLDVLKKDKRNIHENHKIILNKMCTEWESDTNIIDLLTAIILFNPDRPGLIHPELIRYLLIKYGSDCVAKSKFLRLLSCLSDLHVLKDKMTTNWLDDESECMPLMNEICSQTTVSITVA